MKTTILCLLLILSCNIFAQDSLRIERRRTFTSMFFTLGVENNKFNSLNTFLTSQNLPAKFDANRISFGLGFSGIHQPYLLDWYFNFSGKTYNEDSKKIKASNGSLMILYHYRILNHGWLQPDVYSGINWMYTMLNIDSIYNASNIKTFGSTSAYKYFFDVPIGLQFLHAIKSKKNEGKISWRHPSVGLRVAYHINFYQTDWYLGYNTLNKFSYNLKDPNYYEACLFYGF